MMRGKKIHPCSMDIGHHVAFSGRQLPRNSGGLANPAVIANKGAGTDPSIGQSPALALTRALRPALPRALIPELM
jgi:hypothetical protein